MGDADAQDADIFDLARNALSQSSIFYPGRPLPESIDRFTIVGELGRGAMGVVYRAEDPTGRQVALKVVLDPSKWKDTQRFWREGQITAALNHPGIVKIHAAGQVEGMPFLAYELVEGCQALDAVLKSLERPRGLALIRDVTRALAFTHSNGVFHRDVKPDNILVDSDGRARVADFGLAVATDSERLTQTGALVGTPMFMAPEQIRGRRDEHGPWSDVWAVGVILYDYLTGELPFQGQSLVQLMIQISSVDPLRPRRLDRSISADLEAVCLRALTREPEGRYPTCAEFADDLDTILGGGHVVPRPSKLPWVLAGLVVLGLGLGAAVVSIATPGADDPPTPPIAELPVEPAPPSLGAEPPRAPSYAPDLEHTFPEAYSGETANFRFVRADAESTQNPANLWLVGQLLANGKSVGKDQSEAVHWLRRAAVLSPPHMTRLSEWLLDGERLPADPIESDYWLSRAAKNEEPRAMMSLYELLPEAEGLPWLKAAAEHGYGKACAELGARHLDGHGVELNLERANALFQRGADNGEATARRLLAQSYLEGRGVARDVQRGLDMLERARQEGDHVAAFTLATLYRKGDNGLPRDPQRALALYREEAERERPAPEALRGLADMYRAGEGVEADASVAADFDRRADEARAFSDRIHRETAEREAAARARRQPN